MTMRLYLAPIRGVTDAVYRTAFGRHFGGIDVAMAPFVATSQGNKSERTKLRDLLPVNNPLMPVIPQILGKVPDDFIALAQALHDLGYTAVNWNLGCPYPMVTTKGKGSGMLPWPQRIAHFLDATLPRLSLQLSIKLRLGLESADEITRVLPLLNGYPLQEIIIHPRTGRQMYGGTVNLEAFAACLECSRHPVVYNGDIVTAHTLRELQTRFPAVQGWMLGRGLLADPFLAEAVTNPSPLTPARRRSRLQAFHDDLFREYAQLMCGAAQVIDKMKCHWGYLARSFVRETKVLKKIRKAQSIRHYQNVIEELFAGEECTGDTAAAQPPP